MLIHPRYTLPRCSGRFTFWNAGAAMMLLCILALPLVWNMAMQAPLPRGLASALQAGWAVRLGSSPYQPIDEAPFHGPPLAAITFVPLAQPPAGESRSDAIPAPLALFIWYWLSIGLTAGAIHAIAQQLHSELIAGTWPWWRARLLPLVMFAGPLYLLLAHSHADAVLLALVSGWLIALHRRRNGTAGLLLGAAIAFFLAPVVLLVVNILRRDRLMTLATLAGLGLCLMFAPALLFGLARTSSMNQQFFADVWRVHIQPLDPLLLAGLALLTGCTCFVTDWQTTRSPASNLPSAAALLCIMTLGWHAGESHRYVLLLPAVMALPPHRLLQVLLALLLAAPVFVPQAAALPETATVLLWSLHTLQLGRLNRPNMERAATLDEKHEPLPQAA